MIDGLNIKTVVIYQSKTGFVKKYAQWIAEELSADLFEVSKFNTDLFKFYDTIIYGGGLYVGGINGVKLITQNLDKLKGKGVVVFASGATPTREETTIEVRDKNFTTEEQKQIAFFYLRGGFDFNRLNLKDKILMYLMKLKLKMRKNPTPDERGMLKAYGNSVDFTTKKNIESIISHVRQRNGNSIKKDIKKI